MVFLSELLASIGGLHTNFGPNFRSGRPFERDLDFDCFVLTPHLHFSHI